MNLTETQNAAIAWVNRNADRLRALPWRPCNGLLRCDALDPDTGTTMTDCCPLSALADGGPYNCHSEPAEFASLNGIDNATAKEIADAADSFADDDRQHPNPVRARLRQLLAPAE